MLVCGNTWKMLNETRFKDHFDFIGNFENHFGIFEGCGTTFPFSSNSKNDNNNNNNKKSCC